MQTTRPQRFTAVDHRAVPALLPVFFCIFAVCFAFLLLSGCDVHGTSADDGDGGTTFLADDVGAADVLAVTGATPPPTPPTQAALAQLGDALFHDVTLSSGGAQSCASCHAEPTAFSDPDQNIPVSEGAVSARFGTRNAPTAAYTARVPGLASRNTPGGLRWSGGLFMDGRAGSLETQARAPLFGAQEMNLVDANDLLAKLRNSPSRALYETVFGSASLGSSVSPAMAVSRVIVAIAAFERTPALQPYSSKFDAMRAGRATFTAQEQLGMDLFVRQDKGNCIACHSMATGANGQPTVFSNFRYENVGVPRNPDRRFYAADFVDTGLEATLLGHGVNANAAAAERGKFRVPTLRNIARTAPYMHNGVFSDLKTVVEFYNTRDVDRGRWLAIGATEVPQTVDRGRTGNQHLTPQEVDAVVAFLGTLNDGYTP